jgi:C4-dicarboxylate transporter DctM subunit
MNELVLFGLFLLVLLALIALGGPIAFAMGTLAAAGIVAFLSPVQLTQIARVALTYGTSDALLVIPFFLLMAELIAAAEYPQRVFAAVQAWFSALPGSLAISSVIACGAFAAVSGSSAATCATISVTTGPEMIRRGYSKRLAAGALVSGGTLGIMIPPSLAFVLYGIITETSIAKLFIAGILPGLLLLGLLVLTIAGYVLFRADAAPRTHRGDETLTARALLAGALPMIGLSVFVLVGLYLGWVTVTEASAVGAFAALVLALMSGRLTRRNFVEALRRSAITSAVIMFLVFGGVAFAYVISALGLPVAVSNIIAALDVDRWLIIAAICVFLLILGCFMDPLGMLVVTLPPLFPLVMKLGFDPIWFGVVITLMVELAMITPPVGLNLFVLKGAVPSFEMNDIVLGALPFVLVLLVGLAILCIWPEIALTLVPK